MLRGMGDALNPDCEFHRFNQDNPLASDRHKARLIQSICTLSFVMGYLACQVDRGHLSDRDVEACLIASQGRA